MPELAIHKMPSLKVNYKKKKRQEIIFKGNILKCKYQLKHSDNSVRLKSVSFCSDLTQQMFVQGPEELFKIFRFFFFTLPKLYFLICVLQDKCKLSAVVLWKYMVFLSRNLTTRCIIVCSKF